MTSRPVAAVIPSASRGLRRQGKPVAGGVDDLVISLVAKGLTTGEV